MGVCLTSLAYREVFVPFKSLICSQQGQINDLKEHMLLSPEGEKTGLVKAHTEPDIQH